MTSANLSVVLSRVADQHQQHMITRLFTYMEPAGQARSINAVVQMRKMEPTKGCMRSTAFKRSDLQ